MSVAMKKPIAKANMASLIRTERSVSDLRGRMIVQMVMQRHSSEATPCCRHRRSTSQPQSQDRTGRGGRRTDSCCGHGATDGERIVEVQVGRGKDPLRLVLLVNAAIDREEPLADSSHVTGYPRARTHYLRAQDARLTLTMHSACVKAKKKVLIGIAWRTGGRRENQSQRARSLREAGTTMCVARCRRIAPGAGQLCV